MIQHMPALRHDLKRTGIICAMVVQLTHTRQFAMGSRDGTRSRAGSGILFMADCPIFRFIFG